MAFKLLVHTQPNPVLLRVGSQEQCSRVLGCRGDLSINFSSALPKNVGVTFLTVTLYKNLFIEIWNFLLAVHLLCPNEFLFIIIKPENEIFQLDTTGCIA